MAKPDADRPLLSVNIIGKDGDVSAHVMPDQSVVLQVRNVSVTETHAAVHLTFEQAGALFDVLQRAQQFDPLSDPDED